VSRPVVNAGDGVRALCYEVVHPSAMEFRGRLARGNTGFRPKSERVLSHAAAPSGERGADPAEFEKAAGGRVASTPTAFSRENRERPG